MLYHGKTLVFVFTALEVVWIFITQEFKVECANLLWISGLPEGREERKRGGRPCFRTISDTVVVRGSFNFQKNLPSVKESLCLSLYYAIFCFREYSNLFLIRVYSLCSWLLIVIFCVKIWKFGIQTIHNFQTVCFSEYCDEISFHTDLSCLGQESSLCRLYAQWIH